MNTIKRLINKASQLMDDAMDDYADNTFAETTLGVVLYLIVMTTYLFGAAILVITAPIWGLPYLIYKVRKEQKNECNKATNKQERT